MSKSNAEKREQRSRLRSRRRAGRIRVTLLLLITIAMLAFVGNELYHTSRPDTNVMTDALLALSATEAPTAVPRMTSMPTPNPTQAPIEDVTRSPYTPEPTLYLPLIDDETAEHKSATLRITGDLMCSDIMLGYALKAGDGIAIYNFTGMFDLIRDSLSNADYTIGNLETTIGRYQMEPYSGYPRFNSPESFLEAIKGTGYDCLTLANNHMLDRYLSGVFSTVKNVEAFGFDHAGAYTSTSDRNTATVIDVQGFKIGLIPYTQTTNGMEVESDSGARQYAVPWLTKSDIKKDVQRCKDAGAQLVIAFPHWGTEYKRTPDSVEKSYAVKLAQAGVDIIIGSHPHVLQKISMQEIDIGNGNTRPVLIVYSMGNFLSTQYEKQYSDSGMILQIKLQELNDGTIDFSEISYIPTYCWQHDDTVQIVPSAKYLEIRPLGMSDTAYARMVASYNETVALLPGIPVLAE